MACNFLQLRVQLNEMKFQLRPILSEMKEWYSKPISAYRFNEYLSKLQGATKEDLVLPISIPLSFDVCNLYNILLKEGTTALP